MINELKYMKIALNLAKKAAKKGDVPVGAIIVDSNGNIIGKGYNTKEFNNNSLEHAEMMAIAKASKARQQWRLNDCTIYSTLEPCLMCTGAILNARIKSVVFGLRDPKFGCIISKLQLLETNKFNHQAQYRDGILADEIKLLMTNFFQEIRQN